MLVSVIMPVYNVEKYIFESIESVCNQTYDDIEIILVDDGSTDKSVELAKSVLTRYPCIKHQIIAQNNSGLPAARNRGLNYAIGDYICFIDSDDCIDKKHIENIMKMIENNNLLVGFSDFERTSEKNRIGEKSTIEKFEILAQKDLLERFMTRDIKIHCCSLIIHKDLLKNIQFNDRLKYGEDVEFMWRLFSTIEKIGHHYRKTYKYLIRENSIMTTYSLDRDKIFIEEFSLSMDNLKSMYPLNTDIYEKAYYRVLLGWLHQLSMKSSLRTFKKTFELIDKESLIQNLFYFPKMSIKLLSVLLKVNLNIFYYFIRNI